MIDIGFDKRLELLFGLRYCIFNNEINNYEFQTTNKDYCNEFYELFKKYSSKELVEFIKNGGFDTFNRTAEIAFSLDDSYNIISNDFIRKIKEKNNVFDINKITILLNDFVQKSGYEEFYLNHKSYYDEIVKIFNEKLNKYVTFDETLITDFYGYKVGNFQIKLFNFTRGSFGMNFDDNIMYIANLHAPKNGDELVHISDYVIANLFHEFSHPYCNPLGYKYFNENDITSIEEESKLNGLENYYHGITVINEYMVRAVQTYLTNKYIPNFKIENEIKRHESRGYIHIEKLIKLLNLKDQYDNFEDFYKNQIVTFFDNLEKSKSISK